VEILRQKKGFTTIGTKRMMTNFTKTTTKSTN